MGTLGVLTNGPWGSDRFFGEASRDLPPNENARFEVPMP